MASAKTINFDDITVSHKPSYATPSQGYQGFNWTNASWMISGNSDGWWPGIQAHSGQNFAWSNGGHDLTMSQVSRKTFNLDSFWGRNSYYYAPVTMHGFLHGAEIMTQTLNFTPAFQEFTLNFKGIDQVTWTNRNMNILLDDISVSAVPEPGTYTMMLSGIGLLGFMAYRRRKV